MMTCMYVGRGSVSTVSFEHGGSEADTLHLYADLHEATQVTVDLGEKQEEALTMGELRAWVQERRAERESRDEHELNKQGAEEGGGFNIEILGPEWDDHNTHRV